MNYRPDIDGLRGIAVLAVVLFHAFPGLLPGGYTGVDVFFVISGYVITRDLSGRKFGLADFYLRRVRRIFPALLAVLASCVAFGSVFMLDDEFKALLRHVAASSLFAQNFNLLRESGYFDAAATTKPLLHLWSLAVEEQFYFLWPLVLMASRSRALAVAIVVMVASCLAMILWPDPLAGYYLPFTRFWQIMAGACLALSQPKESRWIGLVGAACLVSAFAFADSSPSSAPVWALAATVGASGLIAGRSQFLAPRALVAVGLISYPLYLWHWPLLAFLRLTGEPSTGAVTSAIVAAFVLAWLTARFVEMPIRRATATARRVKAAGVLMALTAVSASAAAAVETRPVGHWQQKFGDLRFHRPIGIKCAPEFDVQCIKTTDQIGGLVLGDSHAEMLFPALNQRGWALAHKPGCSPLLGVRVVSHGKPCGDEMERLVKQFAGDDRAYPIVLAFNSSFEAQGASGAAGSALIGPKAKVLEEGISSTVQALEAGGKSVTLVISVPPISFDPRGCLSRPFIKAPVEDCSFSRQAAINSQAELRAAVADARSHHPSMTVVDPLDGLCDGDVCRVDRDGMLVYRDRHHLSERGAGLVTKLITARQEQ